MSHSAHFSNSDISSRLRATAAAFMPQNAQPNQVIDAIPKQPPESYQHGSYSSDADVTDSYRSTVSDDSYETSAEPSGPALHPQPDAAVSDDNLQCTFCAAIGRVLECCQSPSSERPCPNCASMSKLFAEENEKHKEEVDGLRNKVKELEEETPEAKYKRLCAEKNAKIEALKDEVGRVTMKDDGLKKGIKEQEKILKKLEADLKQLQPRAEFTIKEAKKGKRK